MKRQIISRAFYGWLAYCRHLSTVRTHLSGLVHGRITPEAGAESGLSEECWRNMQDENGMIKDDVEVYRLVYYGGVSHNIRKEVWPFLLGHHLFGTTREERAELDENTRHYYETTMSEWLAVEAIVRQRDKEKTAHAVAKLSSGGSQSGDKVNGKDGVLDLDGELENEVFEENGFSDLSDPEVEDDDKQEGAAKPEPMEPEPETSAAVAAETEPIPEEPEETKIDAKESAEPDESKDETNEDEHASNVSSPTTSSYETVANEFVDYIEQEIGSPSQPISPKPTAVIVTDASIDMANLPNLPEDDDKTPENSKKLEVVEEDPAHPASLDALQEPKSVCASPASSNGGIYSVSI